MGDATLTCSWALCHVLGLCVARPLSLISGGSFQTGEQKFFTSKYKEGDYINIKFLSGRWCIGSFFWTWEPIWPLLFDHKRNESILWGERKGVLGVNWSKTISFGRWKERGLSFLLQLAKDSLEMSNNLQTLPNPAAVCGLPLAPGSFHNLSTCQVPDCLPTTCLPVISPLRDPIIN